MVQRSRTARIVLIAGGIVIAFFGWMMWADEAEHGGWEAMDGLEEGYLADGSVEVRQVPWSNRDEQVAGAYEVRLVSGDTYEVAYIDGSGTVLYTGTLDEVQAWLDDQGDQVFAGTRAEATAWIDDQRNTDKSFVVPAVVIAAGALLIIAGLIPNRRVTEHQPDLTAPPAPAL
jgi:hypothetical protein